MDPGVPVPLLANARGAAYRSPRRGEIIEYKGFNMLLAELEAFAAAVSGERAYPISPEDILHGVAVFEAIVRSAERHQPVAVART